MQDARWVEGSRCCFIHKTLGTLYHLDERRHLYINQQGDVYVHPLKVEANGVSVVNPRVSTGLPVDFAGLPEDAELSNRFLIGHAHGIGPATILGVIVLEQGVEALH